MAILPATEAANMVTRADGEVSSEEVLAQSLAQAEVLARDHPETHSSQLDHDEGEIDRVPNWRQDQLLNKKGMEETLATKIPKARHRLNRRQEQQEKERMYAERLAQQLEVFIYQPPSLVICGDPKCGPMDTIDKESILMCSPAATLPSVSVKEPAASDSPAVVLPEHQSDDPPSETKILSQLSDLLLQGLTVRKEMFLDEIAYEAESTDVVLCAKKIDAPSKPGEYKPRSTL